MIRAFQNRIVLAASALVVGLIAVSSVSRPVSARAEDGNKAGGTPHYTVVMTEGHNLLVTDNANNKLYFYTIGKDKPITSPLVLRASVDLTKVGDNEIMITPHNFEKIDNK